MFSPDDLEKPAKFDMELFKPLVREYPSLNSFEELVFQQLKTHYELINSIVASGRDIYASTLVINGAIVRSLNEYRGALWAIGNGNPHVFSNCLRSHCETLALVHYCTLHPDYIRAATIGARKHPKKELQIVRISKMVDELEKVHKGISLDYSELCERVHPNPASLYASIQPISGNDKELVVCISSRSIVTEETAKRYLDMLTIWTSWIFEELIQLSEIFK
jgi:hypothetical protein